MRISDWSSDVSLPIFAITEPAGAGQALPRSFLRVAGASVAQHQLGLALALDCQRVICLARGTSPELIEVQHAAEDAGLQFYIATDTRQLSEIGRASVGKACVSTVRSRWVPEH